MRGGAAEAGRSTEAALASVLLRHSASRRLSSSHSSGAVSERCRRLRRALGGPAPSILTTHAWPAPSEGRHAEVGVVGSSGTTFNTVRGSSCSPQTSLTRSERSHADSVLLGRWRSINQRRQRIRMLTICSLGVLLQLRQRLLMLTQFSWGL